MSSDPPLTIGEIMAIIMWNLFLSTFFLDFNRLLINFGYGLYIIELNDIYISLEIRLLLLIGTLIFIIGKYYREI